VFPGVASFGLLEVLQRVYLSGAPEHHPVAQYRDERIAGWRENYVYRLASGEVVALYDDVSERKRMEEALRESEQKYRSLFQNIRDAILLADTDRRIIDCNPAFESLFGYSLEEIQGKKTSYVYESDSQFRELGRALREHYDDSSFLMTVQYKKKSGEVFPGETGAFYLKDSAGEVAGFIGVIRDVTDRQQAEEALRKREEHLQAILQAAPDPLVVYDRVGHPQYINPSFTRIFGWTFQELQGQRIPFVPEDQKEATMAKIREIYRTGVPVTFDTKRWTKDERLLDIRVSAAIIQSSREEHHGLVVILTDITERKQLEKRLTELSLYDSLTGLYNRTFFQEEIQRLEDDRYFPMGIIVCDINGLKLINDTLGHDKGDELLRAAADILRQCFRQSDILARIGGDEFTVLLPNSGEEIVQACCRRIREEVGRFNQQSAGFGISLALGYAVDQAPPTDLEGLFKRADDAMYKEKLQQSHSSRNETVQALIKTLEERDHITEGHAGRLNEYAQKLGRLAGLSADRLQDLQLLARFHDLGKVGIPDFILFKPGPLTREEFQEMKRHCEIGHRIALSLNDLAPIADYILKHHEHWDGRGYPLGLSGEDIPLECRILAIVDAYDTMIHKRPYKEPMSHEDAVAELGRCAGTQFDPELVWEFLRIVQESGEG
jgi:diguanylate cyclase (GGDEF)-like protein/PAS domain S-box-containing protein